ncbi:glycine--tRNA ligase subunit beta [Aurantiacibacter sp. D1-12]|uniref:glycine--tRNA ligase subunit beta n=1 Tax=Aurantiacibacter sp. D1-12 TaxID=2993658 RepID=UPI00237CFA28|nr:glycine--tRNA ligase subunit beta [Aurantiacibacter sp. D1-12]MDE1466693.1 glycine--tRNA ligase subunit beta [Aurantiacibacter sp. D1-12]
MSDFLLELRCEEIPARMQAGARAELEKLFRREMDASGVAVGELTVWSTPRRLALIARELPEATEAVSEEAKGPPVGAPDQAVDGFCRKNGVTRDDLEVRDVKGRETYFAVKNIPGRAMSDLLAEAIPAIIRDFSWPKSMRWGAASLSTESLRWVRPLSGIVAMLGSDVVKCEVDEFVSGRYTKGHRFHSRGLIEISDADTYAGNLREANVIVDHEERAAIIRKGAMKAAEAAGLKLVEDEGLVVENAGLTEWPVPLLGRFDEDFLGVPPEVIQLTARVNQKYFVCEDADGKLADAFICTANIEAVDPAVVVDGNRKVLAARLSDARFFWELDKKTPLEEHAKKLERITFHEKLGTVADKVERVAKLARWLVEEGIVGSNPTPATKSSVRPEPVEGRDGEAGQVRTSTSSARTVEELADLAEQAARLCKADLVTEMVGEFPELQGLMGGYYARAEGLPDEVADAIRDHYKPVGQGDNVPTAPLTVAVSLADKLDTMFSFFSVELYPTGSKDPFALRRAMLGIIATVLQSKLRVPITQIARAHYDLADGPLAWFLDFLDERLKVQQREAGVRHDLIDAVFALGGEDDLVRLLARVHALQAFIETDNGTNLLAGYKRAANILKKEEWDANAELSYTPEPAEKALIDALDVAEPQAATAIEAEDFAAAMSALASLRAPIDAFFEEVTVNDDDANKRNARLDLLARFRAAVHNVADFSKIEG